VLVTQTGERLQGTISIRGNQLVTTISNAQLQLAEGQSFRRNSPVPSITSVVVTAIEPNSIQIIVTGTNSAPEGEIVSRPDGLTLSVLPALPEEEIVVTAQKRPEPAQNVPISLTVIPRQTLEDTQINALQGISDNAPNFSFFPTNAGGSDFAYYSIRGLNNFNFLVSQDSVGFYRTHLGSPEGVRTVPRQV
jgi:iron complex outermembrane receptor protein